MPAHLHAGSQCVGGIGWPCSQGTNCWCHSCLDGGKLLLCEPLGNGQFFCFHSEYLGEDALSDAETRRIQDSLKAVQKLRAVPAPPAAAAAPSDPVADLIKAFAAREGHGCFPYVRRKLVALDLLARVSDPSAINQGPTYMCGPAAFVYSFARDHPLQYAQFVIDLYEKGVAHAGGLEVRPSERFRREWITPGIPAADWVAMGSLRDSENFLFSYHNGYFEHFLGGTTSGSVTSWFQKSGYRDVQDFTTSSGQMMNAHLANDYLKRGYRVCLLVDADMLGDEPTQRSVSISANHFVVLTSPISETDDGVTFTVYTWRSERREIPMKAAGRPAGRMPRGVFLSKYYGFIAGKP